MVSSSPTPESSPEGPNKISVPLPYPNPITTGNENFIRVKLNFNQPEGTGRLVLFTNTFLKISEVPLGNIEPGEQTVQLPIINKYGGQLANGIYFAAVITQRGTATGKILVLR